MIDHSTCTHLRTPAGRSVCRRQMSHIPAHDAPVIKQAREASIERSAKVRPHDVMQTRRSRSSGALRALSDAPTRVRVFIKRCEVHGFEVTEVPVKLGFSLEIHSSRGAGRVTWNGEAVQWFTRLGYTSITTRVKNLHEVWEALGVPLEES